MPITKFKCCAVDVQKVRVVTSDLIVLDDGTQIRGRSLDTDFSDLMDAVCEPSSISQAEISGNEKLRQELDAFSDRTHRDCLRFSQQLLEADEPLAAEDVLSAVCMMHRKLKHTLESLGRSQAPTDQAT